jgi:hypothetical protein
MYDHGHEASINDGLHLLLIASGDVGQEPHSLLHVTKQQRLKLKTNPHS